MQRIGLLNGNNITYDKDNTAGLLASLTAGVISGFGITGSGAGASIQAGKALIECTRSNGEKIMLYFENTADFAVDLSGTKKVYILVDQTKIDDGSSNAENGTGIASIQTGASYPADNFIALYSIASGTPTDARIYIKIKKEILDLFNLSIPIKTSSTIEGLTMTANEFSTPTGGLQSQINNLLTLSVSARGDGSDGDVTITTTITLTRDMYYNNITINSPGIINTNGYKIFAKDTLSGTGIIRCNGGAGGNASGKVAGTAGVAVNGGSLNVGMAGVAGVDGQAGAGLAGTSGLLANPSYLNINGANGGDSGAGYNGGSMAGGVGGVSTRGYLYNINYNFEKVVCLLYLPSASLNLSQYKISASSGGGAGGAGYGNGGTWGGGGGGSGATGGLVYIKAKTINFTGTIEAKGGAGGNGGNAVATYNGAGGGGGGAGGNGGVIFLVSVIFTSIGTTIVTGGVGGSGGAGAFAGGSGPAGNGTAGGNGGAGAVIQITE